MVLDKMLIDVEKNKLKIGNVIGISGIYYRAQNWYVSSVDDYSVTLVGLDDNYKPLETPKVLNVEINLIHYYLISKTNKKLKIDQSYLNQFYKNKGSVKKARYGDIILLETICGTSVPFYVLNYDPISGSYLVYEILFSDMDYKNSTKSLILELCQFKVVSNKELRRDIFEKSKKMHQMLQTSNYNELMRIDDIIEFQAKMEYLAEKSQKCEMKLKELEFLNNESLLFKALDFKQPSEKLVDDELFISNFLKEFNSMDTIDEEEYPFPIFKTDDNFFCLSEEDDNIDFKNEETFGMVFPTDNDDTIAEGNSFEPSLDVAPTECDNDIDLKNEETFGVGMELPATVALECDDERDDYETLEKSDFETMEISVADEKGCSIM
jgi:hypothetical protein